MRRTRLTLFLAVSSTVVLANIASPFENDKEVGGLCVGHDIAISRLRPMSKTDAVLLLSVSSSFQTGRTYSRTKSLAIMQDIGSDQAVAPNRCIGTRHRLQETILGVPIFGADIIVTTNNCDAYFFSEQNDSDFFSTLAQQPSRSVQSLEGKTFTRVNVEQGYTPDKTPEEVVAKIASILGVREEAIGQPALEVFVSTGGDFLAYRVECIVESNGWADVVEIVADAHDLSLLSKCTKTAPYGSTYRQRKLQRSVPSSYHRKPFNCASCASSHNVSWFEGTTATCPLSSLYLNDAQLSTICTKGLKQVDGTDVLGPGPVDAIFWGGTLDCNGTANCSSVVLPTCRDAISDVQFGGIATLNFLRDHLGIMGGLSEDINDPAPIVAHAHYLDQYCNAFYTVSQNAVYFGDCNCETWAPLVSLDIIGHEIFHGVTAHSSKLIYSRQSGGLNEGFSDIFGTVLEFYLDDSNDPPDFTMAEQAGEALRNMEHPLSKSIGSVCDYSSNLQVHYASGPLNKAYANSVRLCEANGCDDLRGCAILLGKAFLYSNIKGLTRTSNYLDSAKASCMLIDEFFFVRAPASGCSADAVKQFITAGWKTVDVIVSNDCSAEKSCATPSPGPTRSPATPMPAPSTALPTVVDPEQGPPTVPSAAPSDAGNDEGSWCRNVLRAVFSWVTNERQGAA